MDKNNIWEIKSYRPNPVIGFVVCVFSIGVFVILLTAQPLKTFFPVAIVLVVMFLVGIYDVLKRWIASYPVKIQICTDGLQIVYSKGIVKRYALKEIKRIEFNIRQPQRGWYKLSKPKFEFYDSRDKLIVEGDVPNYEQFQEIYSLLKCFDVKIFIPDYTKASYAKFFTPRKQSEK